MASGKNLFERRERRTRFRLSQAANGRPRLSVFRSGRHIYAQVIDDGAGSTLATASTNEKEGGRERRGMSRQRRASARRSPSARWPKGVKQVVFDRGGYIYHGRVKALAEAAREGGLEF